MRRSVVLVALLGLAATLSAATVAVWLRMGDAEPSPPASASPPNEHFLEEFPPREHGHPIFVDVTEVVLHWDQSTRVVLEGSRLRQAVACLEQTRELGEPLEEPPLEDPVLLQVADRYGDRMFEVSSEHAFKGGKGRRYWSPCISSVAVP